MHRCSKKDFSNKTLGLYDITYIRTSTKRMQYRGANRNAGCMVEVKTACNVCELNLGSKWKMCRIWFQGHLGISAWCTVSNDKCFYFLVLTHQLLLLIIGELLNVELYFERNWRKSSELVRLSKNVNVFEHLEAKETDAYQNPMHLKMVKPLL